MDEGSIKGVHHASRMLNQSDTRTEHILNMLMLSPAIQSEIINANPEDLDPIAEYKIRDLSFEIDWNKQAELWRKAKSISD